MTEPAPRDPDPPGDGPGDAPPRLGRRPPPLTGKRWTAGVAATVAAAVYAWFASSTTPFTIPADVTTAIPLMAMVTVVVLQRLQPVGALWQRIPEDRPPEGGSAVPWLLLLALLVVPEVASLLAGHRSSHPTLSSLSDTLFEWHAAKAAVYFLWLWLCWYVVRR